MSGTFGSVTISKKQPLKGIDISEFQGKVDFDKVKSDGVSFLILRSGYSTVVDAMFHEYTIKARAAGLPVYGVYHFSYARSAEQAKKEAEFCVKEVEKAGLGKDIFIFYDLEYDSVRTAAKHGVTIGRVECIEFTKAFCDTVKSKGYKAGIYCNLDYYKNMYDPYVISSYPLWLAFWSGNPGIGSDFLQYSATGKVQGIHGDVDLDYCYTDDVSGFDTDFDKLPIPGKTVEELAKEVLDGKWGNGDDRKKRLTEAGYDYNLVQGEVNRLLTSDSEPKPEPKPESRKEVSTTAYAQSFDYDHAGKYKVVASNGLYLRDGAGVNKPEMCVIPYGTIVTCYGFFTVVGNTEWLVIQFEMDHALYTGFSSGDYLKKI